MNATAQAASSPAEPAEPLRVRWPIHLQLLVPMVAVVLLATLLATAITAYWIALRVRSEQSKDLRRVVETMGKSDFPKTRQVLDQISGLSGAEFVLLTPDGSLRESTLPMEGRGCDRPGRKWPNHTELATASSIRQSHWATAIIWSILSA